MTPNELTTLLAEPHGREFDEPFKLMVFDRAMVWYARLARNTIDKDPRRRAEFTRSVIMTMAPSAESGGCTSVDCLYSESTLEVPTPLFANGILFDYVGSSNGSSAFSKISGPSALRIFAHNKYYKHKLFFSYINNKIQVYKNSVIPQVRLDGVFLDLKKLYESDCTCVTGGFWNTDMRIPGDILQLIIESVSKSDLAKPINENQDEVKVTNK